MKHYTDIKGIALSSQFSNHNGSVCCVLTQTHSPKWEPLGLANAEAVTLPNTQDKTYLTKQKCNKNTQTHREKHLPQKNTHQKTQQNQNHMHIKIKKKTKTKPTQQTNKKKKLPWTFFASSSTKILRELNLVSKQNQGIKSQ